MSNNRETDEAIQIIRRFELLPIEKRVEIFAELSPQARDQLLETLSRPGEIIRRISEEEMFFNIKSLREENAPNLIRWTTGRQLVFLLDVDLWKRENFDVNAFSRWLEILGAIGEDKLLQFVQTADPELLVTALSRLIRVRMRDPDLDMLEQREGLPAFTLDDVFFVDFRAPSIEERLKELLDVIFRWKTEFYFSLMEELAWGVHLESEASALHWRRVRLLDHGFPEFDEALEIYQYLDRGKLSELPDAGPSTGEITFHGGRPLLQYPMKLLELESLFRSSLEDIGDRETRDRLIMELAHLANKVIIADGRDPGDVEELHISLRKVSGYINIALEELCGRDISKAVALLRSNHVEFLFRRGFSLILDLRKRAQRFLTAEQRPVEDLGYPLAGLVDGLMLKRPVYASNYVGGKAAREFEYLEDLHTISELLDKATSEDRWETV